MIDIYNDAKHNVGANGKIDLELPASDPYASVLFPPELQTQEFDTFPKVINCAQLQQSACKTTILQELSEVVLNSKCNE